MVTLTLLLVVIEVIVLLLLTSIPLYSLANENIQELVDIIPVVDISAVITANSDGLIGTEFCSAVTTVSTVIDKACRSVGFFYIRNHSVSIQLQTELESIARQFFLLSIDMKNEISMSKGGRAWRGYFSVGEEVTSAIADQKEGIYFGTEEAMPIDNKPLHGPNLWLNNSIGTTMKSSVLTYMNEMKLRGQLLMRTIACSLGMSTNADSTNTDRNVDPVELFTNKFEKPTQLFRIFNYPPHNSSFGEKSMGVGEHTDYGYLTLLKQDNSGGLQVKDVNGNWLNAPPIDNTFVVNLGDALEHNLQGLYRATPHRVQQRQHATSDRLSMPYFFDPNFDSVMSSMVPFLRQQDQDYILEMKRQREAGSMSYQKRWDDSDPALFEGTYGDYLLRKVSKAFPELAEEQQIRSDVSGEL